MTIQIVREEPPGFGGVERTAAQLATAWGTEIYYFRRTTVATGFSLDSEDRLRKHKLGYIRISRLFIPLPGKKLVNLFLSKEHIHAHLPSAEILFLICLVKLISPRRLITVHWHAILECRPIHQNLGIWVYQKLALFAVNFVADYIVTTSLALKTAVQKRIRRTKHDNVLFLHCAISEELEKQLLSLKRPISNKSHLNILYIGRKTGYKSLEMLIQCAEALENSTLHVIGIKPEDIPLSSDTAALLNLKPYGLVSEDQKIEILSTADILVLPSISSNEAFGIVQLEAMASGIPSIAFTIQDSAVGWICQIQDKKYSPSIETLVGALKELNSDRKLLLTLSDASKRRYLELFAYQIWHTKAIEMHHRINLYRNC